MLSNLKATLTARRMHQVDLAEAVGIAPSKLSDFIHGRAELAPHQRERIATLLRADSDWLFSSVIHIPAPKSVAEPEVSCTA